MPPNGDADQHMRGLALLSMPGHVKIKGSLFLKTNLSPLFFLIINAIVFTSFHSKLGHNAGMTVTSTMV
jgi:hypothetical protein